MVGAEAGCLSHLLLTEETAQAPSESGGELSPPTPRARSPAHQKATGLSTGGGAAGSMSPFSNSRHAQETKAFKNAY